MRVEPLPPIPSPPAHLWRQFRVKFMPVTAFAVVLCLAVVLWSKNLANPLVMGTAEGLEAEVTSPQAGMLTELRVMQYQEVRADEILAVITPATPQILSNTLAVLRAEMDVVRADSGFDGGDKVRYAQFHLDWMQRRADLLQLQSQVVYAEKEYQRQARLLETKILDQANYDIAERDLRQAREMLEIQTAAVADAEKAVRALDPTTAPPDSPLVLAQLKLVQDKLSLAEAEFMPVVIRPPSDGRVSKISKLTGTSVAEGESILTVASPKVQYILGYIGQPLRIEPTVGMKVEVRSRGQNRTVGQAQVTHVGPRIELFNAPLRVRGMGNALERGLPIVVSVPPEMKLRPGELVELSLAL